MARATGLGSMFWGKVGNLVGYLTRNRQGRYVQSVKAYQPIVANPQSIAQALARIPMGPVQRFYNALAPIIKRGFEGVAYGDPSKSEFLSYNLANFRGPYLLKSDVAIAPGPFLMSKGSLGGVKLTSFINSANSHGYITTLRAGYGWSPSDIATLSTALLNNNPWLVYGDQLTFVTCQLVNGEYVYGYASFFVSPYDETAQDTFYSMLVDGHYYLALKLDALAVDAPMVAGCVIRSQAYGQTGFRRSTTFMQVNPAYSENFTEDALKAAVRSYREGSDGDDDWPIDPTPEYQQIADLILVTITDDMVTNWTSQELTGQQCLGYVTKSGDIGIFYLYDDNEGGMCLLDGAAHTLFADKSGSMTAFFYNSDYQPAVQYQDSYGTIFL